MCAFSIILLANEIKTMLVMQFALNSHHFTYYVICVIYQTVIKSKKSLHIRTPCLPLSLLKKLREKQEEEIQLNLPKKKKIKPGQPAESEEPCFWQRALLLLFTQAFSVRRISGIWVSAKKRIADTKACSVVVIIPALANLAGAPLAQSAVPNSAGTIFVQQNYKFYAKLLGR